ncbi:ABC transporter permease [Acuticoccus sediminis]|uniref:ABC transporter permease n=1 Tax=Acuticoccus sediminis TaxID=2184697 RepID=A0A8B2NVF5_9HYPH|nr:ABC transporter permease [Acuticoccus sediminis]RAI02479.1 ABC transporter permease [Acuticoccus sediminis]
MLNYLARRIGLTVISLAGVLLISFVLTRMSGDPTSLLLPVDATDEARAALRARLGLDQPYVTQFIRYVGDAMTGDFGNSLRFSEPVTKLLMERLGATFELAIATILLALVIGIPSGILAAYWQRTPVDSGLQSVAAFAQAVPTFYWGILGILLFSVWLGWLPTGGRGSWLHLVLPAVTLASTIIALIMRIMRSCMLDVLRQDYIRTARAKGVPEYLVVIKHAGRNAIIPLVTVVALQCGVLIGGVVVTETVFSWPGIGRLAIQAIYARDYPVVQIVVIFFAVVFVILNLVADILSAVLDPRIRLS